MWVCARLQPIKPCFVSRKCLELCWVFGALAHTLSLNIPGYHFHFLADDHSSGGHVLDLKADSLEIELDFQSNLRLAHPETQQFREADFFNDISEQLHTAETKPQESVGDSADLVNG